MDQAIKNGEAKDMGGPCSKNSDCSTGSCTSISSVCECTSDTQCGKSSNGEAYTCATSVLEANSCQDTQGNSITPVMQIPTYNQIEIPLNVCTYCGIQWVYTWVGGTPSAAQEADRLANGLGFGGWIGARQSP